MAWPRKYLISVYLIFKIHNLTQQSLYPKNLVSFTCILFHHCALSRWYFSLNSFFIISFLICLGDCALSRCQPSPTPETSHMSRGIWSNHVLVIVNIMKHYYFNQMKSLHYHSSNFEFTSPVGVLLWLWHWDGFVPAQLCKWELCVYNFMILQFFLCMTHNLQQGQKKGKRVLQ